MPRLLVLALIAILLAGCAQQPPEGLRAVIEKEHPNAQYLETRFGSAPGRLNTFWCVAYKPEPSGPEPLILVEMYNDQTWIPLTEVWAREFHINDPKPDGGWCYRVQQ